MLASFCISTSSATELLFHGLGAHAAVGPEGGEVGQRVGGEELRPHAVGRCDQSPIVRGLDPQ
ncbi:MAG: hypothetical protein ACK55I_04740, partial [bacterium]